MTVNVYAAVAATPEVVSFGSVKLGSRPEQKLTLQSNAPFKILEVRGTDEEVIVRADKDTAQPPYCHHCGSPDDAR